jgi:polyphosphate glucokinase
LVIDIGGTGLKASVLDARGKMLTERVRVPTTYPTSPDQLLAQLSALVAALPAFDRVSVGFPGVVRRGIVLSAPHFVTTGGPGTPNDKKLTAAWQAFDLGAALSGNLSRPVRITNDADLQGLDVSTGSGVEVVITLGTGLGFCVLEDGKNKSYDDKIGDAARKKVGNRRWNKRVRRLLKSLDALTFFDHLYIGGGNARHLTGKLGSKVSIIEANAGLLGGFQLWTRPPT